MNVWHGHGRLTKDPDVRCTQSGKLVASFTLAVDRKRGKNQQQNDNQPTADFISCVAWDKLAETMQRYCGKGKELVVGGPLRTRSYEDKQGVKRYVTECVVQEMDFCGRKDDGGSPAGGAAPNGNGGQAAYNDMEIPF